MTLYNPQQGHAAFAEAWMHAKAALMAGHRLTLDVKPAKRSNEQNAKLHAILQEISAQIEWSGQKLDIQTWKRLCVASWLRENKESPVLIPALDGNGFDVIYEKTSKLNITQCSSLIEWCIAFGVEHGVEFGSMENEC